MTASVHEADDDKDEEEQLTDDGAGHQMMELLYDVFIDNLKVGVVLLLSSGFSS